MAPQQDQAAWNALADLLADAAKVHSAAADTAEDPRLKDRLSTRAGRLQLLVANVQARTRHDDPGTSFHLLDELKLVMDSCLGDDDEAARTASSESKVNLIAFLDDRLRDPELSPDTLAAFENIRGQISAAPMPATHGARLRDLPS